MIWHLCIGYISMPKLLIGENKTEKYPNEDKSDNPGERMYLDTSSMRKPSMGGRQHWAMLVDEATKYKNSFFLKKKNEQVKPIIDWIKALKAKEEIQVKIIRYDNAEETKALETESDKMICGFFLNIQPQEHHSRMEWWKEHLLQSWEEPEQ